MVSVGDIEEGIKRARGECEKMDELLKKAAGVKKKAVKEIQVDKTAEADGEYEGLENVLDKAAEEEEERGQKLSARSSIASVDETVDAVSVVVPPQSTSLNFVERYKTLVLDPSQIETKKTVVYSEPKHVAGELLMLRFTKDAGGLEVDGLGDGGSTKTGYFSPENLKSDGYGELENASDLEVVEICKRMADGIVVEHSALHLMQLN